MSRADGTPVGTGARWEWLDLLTLLCQTAAPTYLDDEPTLPKPVAELQGAPRVVACYWAGLYLLRASGLRPLSVCDEPPT